MARLNRNHSDEQRPKESGSFCLPLPGFFASVAAKWYKEIRSARLVTRTLQDGP
jgi:hypothetical protein